MGGTGAIEERPLVGDAAVSVRRYVIRNPVLRLTVANYLSVSLGCLSLGLQPGAFGMRPLETDRVGGRHDADRVSDHPA